MCVPARATDRPQCVAGLDEVGRGALAGPVIAAAVVLDPSGTAIDGLADSKCLTAVRREALAAAITAHARAWAVGRAEASEVDRLNVLEASMLAMQRAFRALATAPDWALVDGNRFPSLGCSGEAIVAGDASVPAIMAASILAKVHRDREMAVLDALYPHYGFARHKGYPTPLHKERLREWGPCPLHRLSFSPVKRASARCD